MASELSDVLSTLDNEQSEALDLSSIAVSSVNKKRQRPRTAKIWDYTPVSRETILVSKDGKVIWRCKYCLKDYLERGGTVVIATHLLETHNIDIGSMQASKTLIQQSNIIDAFQRGQQSNHKRRCLSTVATQTLDPATLENLYIRWITTCGISFRMVAREEFRTLLQYLNPEINNWLPTTHTTIQSWTIRTYELEKFRIQQAVQSALSKIHFTVDLWTSPNSLAILGVIGHYVAENGDLQQSILALVELDGHHTGQKLYSNLYRSQLILKFRSKTGREYHESH